VFSGMYEGGISGVRTFLCSVAYMKEQISCVRTSSCSEA